MADQRAFLAVSGSRAGERLGDLNRKDRRNRGGRIRFVPAAFALLGAGVAGSCGTDRPAPTSTAAEQTLTTLRARFGDALPSATRAPDQENESATGIERAEVTLPTNLETPFRVEDKRSGAAVE